MKIQAYEGERVVRLSMDINNVEAEMHVLFLTNDHLSLAEFLIRVILSLSDALVAASSCWIHATDASCCFSWCLTL
jgi:tRNA pseudouridine-54 N-methylase